MDPYDKTPRLPAPPSPADPSSTAVLVSTVSALILALRPFLRGFLRGPLGLAHVALDRRLKSRPQVFSVHLV
ncbi:hypothetical protein GGP72_003310 [Salinibacter ruber]|uniref:Uncharacterized protein n=1 Tax=Salinibacter ruber TaxID=146919 RepID=A0A9X2Q4A9_9BACT|nr:hypothetical protein [Salinibacter ruber]MCS3682646.1 hypothetical protein [Salinibacter ruber]